MTILLSNPDSMSDAPGSYFVFDPGRTCGWAYCLPGGVGMRHGTWKFKNPSHGATFSEFATFLKRTLKDLPDPLVAMELATLVGHGESNRLDAKQVVFSAGWPSITQVICHSLGLREPQMIAIQTWRSKSHGKVQIPKTKKGLTQAQRSKWFKQQAKDYCDRNGWSYNSEDEAEALCMLDAVRVMNEPGHAFDNGRAYKQDALF